MEKKRFKLMPEMEGTMARWYARQRGTRSQLDAYRIQAERLAGTLPAGAKVLEIAPGPGYFAVELARHDHIEVTGLDVSRTFVQIAAENAQRAGVKVDFRQGDVAGMPFAAESFDLVICQAAFKNFAEPGRALSQIYRVLRPAGLAIIEDMSREASRADIAAEVGGMRLSGFNAFMTRLALAGLRRRAYSPERFRELVAASPFRTCEIHTEGIGLEVRLTRHP
ncbi:methyltransferase type 11 [Rhizocola hellebori]|uniref:Methyltransferase type 11 n=1 Tax=Rhizocola hellebori TaxID=1392758 RepID=A0A8J3VJE6_9ACTN|nr:class I SAM-dependent methyltransferase [Rhizocola hellebori]GIH08605.1 methyltransferase type 11 [Rhizocola hellebori]